MDRAQKTQVGGNILWVRLIILLVLLLGVFFLGRYSADKSADLQATIEEQGKQISQLEASTTKKDSVIEQLRRQIKNEGGDPTAFQDPSAATTESDKNGNVVSQTYKVREHDTLMSIAKSVYGDENLYIQIQNANNISSNNALRTGQVLIIPEKPSEN